MRSNSASITIGGRSTVGWTDEIPSASRSVAMSSARSEFAADATTKGVTCENTYDWTQSRNATVDPPGSST